MYIVYMYNVCVHLHVHVHCTLYMCVCVCVHACVLLSCFQFDPWSISLPLSFLWCASFGAALTGVAVATVWYRDRWKGHPLMKALSRTGQPPRSEVRTSCEPALVV